MDKTQQFTFLGKNIKQYIQDTKDVLQKIEILKQIETFMLLPPIQKNEILGKDNYKEILYEQDWGFDEWIKIKNSDMFMHTCNILQLYETKLEKREYDLDSFLKQFLPVYFPRIYTTTYRRGYYYLMHLIGKEFDQEVVLDNLSKFLRNNQETTKISATLLIIKDLVQIIFEDQETLKQLYKKYIISQLGGLLKHPLRQFRTETLKVLGTIRLSLGFQIVESVMLEASKPQKIQFQMITKKKDFGEEFNESIVNNIKEEEFKANNLFNVPAKDIAQQFNEQIPKEQFRVQKQFFQDLNSRIPMDKKENNDELFKEKFQLQLYFKKSIHFDPIQQFIVNMLKFMDSKLFKVLYEKDVEIIVLYVIKEMSDSKDSLNQLSIQIINGLFEIGYEELILNTIFVYLNAPQIKPINASIQILIDLLKNWGFDRCNKLEQILPIMDSFCYHNNKYIRKWCLNFYVEVHRWIGDQVLQYMNQIKQQQMMELKLIFRDQDRENVYPLKSVSQEILQKQQDQQFQQIQLQQQQKLLEENKNNEQEQEAFKLDQTDNQDLNQSIQEFINSKGKISKNTKNDIIYYILEEEDSTKYIKVLDQLYQYDLKKQNQNQEFFCEISDILINQRFKQDNILINIEFLNYSIFQNYFKLIISQENQFEINQQQEILILLMKILDYVEKPQHEEFFESLSDQLFIICDNDNSTIKELVLLKTEGMNLVSKIIFTYGDHVMQKVVQNLTRETKQIKRNLEKFEFIKQTKEYQSKKLQQDIENLQDNQEQSHNKNQQQQQDEEEEDEI